MARNVIQVSVAIPKEMFERLERLRDKEKPRSLVIQKALAKELQRMENRK